MQLPNRTPLVKWISILWVIYMAIWAMLEGGLRATVFASLFTILVTSGQLFNRYLHSRRFSTSSWLAFSAAVGAVAGAGCGLLTLLFMAIKTGLHAHGPEFSAADIDWVLQQIPLWIFVGLLSGLGIGFLGKAAAR
jgi:hypothetical protein